MLFAGDIEAGGESRLLARGANPAADVLVVAHHGSRTSTSTGFLLATRPARAIISVGRDNDYGHPHPDILARLREHGGNVSRTAEALRVERSNLYRKLNAYGIRVER